MISVVGVAAAVVAVYGVCSCACLIVCLLAWSAICLVFVFRCVLCDICCVLLVCVLVCGLFLSMLFVFMLAFIVFVWCSSGSLFFETLTRPRYPLAMTWTCVCRIRGRELRRPNGRTRSNREPPTRRGAVQRQIALPSAHVLPGNSSGGGI